MSRPLSLLILLALAPITTRLAAAATASQTAATSIPGAQQAVHQAAALALLTSAQVTDALYDTVNWYRTLGSQAATNIQAGDTLILYANQQIATQVVRLALDMARADAELLSSEANQAPTAPGVGTSAEALNNSRARLEMQARQIQAELQTARESQSTRATSRDYLAAKISELQGELAVVNARRNLTDTVAQFVSGTDSESSGANALKEHIAAVEATIPGVNSAGPQIPAPVNVPANGTVRRRSIWELAANAFSLAGKANAIDSLDRSTAGLEAMFQKLQATPVAAIKALAARSDALSAQADRASSATMKQVRNQLDTVAWQFKQTASIVAPLSKERVVLEQYRQNLKGWRAIVQREERSALRALALQFGVLAVLLIIILAAGELWRRAVLRYEHEARRRHQWLLVRRLTLWTLVITVVGFTLVSEVSSIATFAGLITAGLAVAMQSVIVSVVGYFFLIGKYGVRVGDRVQIGDVTGEVVELGLVRMHLMELSSKTDFAPTGRIVAFANSIVFQASGGLFRQIPGVNFAWHDITLSLPVGIDYAAAKEAMLNAVTGVVKQHQDSMIHDTSQLQETLATRDSGKATPRVQLRFLASEVQAHVWYPVYLPLAAEIDERVSQELWKAIASVAAHSSAPRAELPSSRGEVPVQQ